MSDDDQPMSVADFISKYGTMGGDKSVKQWWGQWYFDPVKLTLDHLRFSRPTDPTYDPTNDLAGGMYYSVYLGGANMNTSAQMLDWIMQVAGKQWVTNEILGDLVHALNDIFKPQSNLCSHGWGKVSNGTNLAILYAERLRSS